MKRYEKEIIQRIKDLDTYYQVDIKVYGESNIYTISVNNKAVQIVKGAKNCILVLDTIFFYLQALRGGLNE